MKHLTFMPNAVRCAGIDSTYWSIVLPTNKTNSVCSICDTMAHCCPINTVYSARIASIVWIARMWCKACWPSDRYDRHCWSWAYCGRARISKAPSHWRHCTNMFGQIMPIWYRYSIRAPVRWKPISRERANARWPERLRMATTQWSDIIKTISGMDIDRWVAPLVAFRCIDLSNWLIGLIYRTRSTISLANTCWRMAKESRYHVR